MQTTTTDAIGRAYERLTPDQRAFLELVAGGTVSSINQAVSQSPISRSTYNNWKANPDFLEVLGKVAGSTSPQSLVAWHGRLVSMAATAVQRLEEYFGEAFGEPEERRDQAKLAMAYLKLMREQTKGPKAPQPKTIQGNARELTMGALRQDNG